MINQIILFSINNKLIIGLLTIALIAIGIWSISEVPLDAVPDITNNQVQIITQTPNLGTEDIEQFVTYPVELAMSYLPGVTEIRSTSRFGLSVVTIVFEDNMGTYLPRQLVSEKLNDVINEIPIGFGKPFLGPISTGLGEIYQYTLSVEEEFKEKYSTTELRTIQDWIVNRQMALVKGVVEVNSIGGAIKQYEIAINPNDLKSFNLTLIDVLRAVEDNNQNTGGAYIEKNHMANFIRGEGLARNISDVEEIVIKNYNGIPLTVKDIAKVQYAEAIRYGALTQDGNGEVVGGLVMMLKGENSNEVIKDVKNRMIEIQKSLPEGVKIEPLLDRSKLINQTTSTVGTNLAEGALIVIFVLVLLLGHWRGGLIVASTIPLSLLFAFIMMNIFDVWANLMSLGAIDFGIIIDGAVIIVESTVFLIHDKFQKNQVLTKTNKDEIAFSASSKMMNSAFFGQLIVLIVFIPILALEGVEGKMFKPMALTFMFAMGGVMLLCLTYVPMMSALFLNNNKSEKKSIGDKFIIYLERIYGSVLIICLGKAKWFVTSSLILLVSSIFIFNQLGGEFIPQLDEGDLAFHAILKPGSSLTETIETTTKIEQIVKSNFPEVDKIVSRIGVAEIPTDPMPMDIADIFVILKPRDEWVSASSKDELVEKIKEAVEKIPGVNYEFTQPIEMRFNELLEGVREDVAIKLYGEDTKILADKANEIASIIAGTDGIGDMKVEATSGLPQMTVVYNRKKLAQYGLNVNELNEFIQTAFAGKSAGVIFEGEKRFDLVVRFAKQFRTSIIDIKNLFIPIPNGSQIPLNEVADIDYSPGPMQISRDNTNRRTYVGINVRGRDVKSLVHEIQNKLDSKLDLPSGYYIRYGGAFENLERATSRLKIVVPISLALIFLLIFFALKSFKQTTMIYMAIPLASIGGIFSLWIRDMPFSISAGIGFIVLFGVAVLNGIVLISAWNELKDEGVDNLDERIKLGAKRRIRPILLTALTDVLGFLPMAISNSAGAEVQQPLATVVIGGMISATLLTLFILPILYKWTENKNGFKIVQNTTIATFLFISLITTTPLVSQEIITVTNLDEAISIATKNNDKIKSSKIIIDINKADKPKAYNFGKTNFSAQYGQFNSFENDVSFEFNQSFQFPTVYYDQKVLADENIKASEILLEVTQNTLNKEIKETWYELAYLLEQNKLLMFQDSIYQNFLKIAKIKYETEESSLLEKVTAETKLMEIQNSIIILESDIQIQKNNLNLLLNSENDLDFNPQFLDKIELKLLDNTLMLNNPTFKYINQKIAIAEAEKSVIKSKVLPDFSIGYFNQSNIGSINQDGSISNTNDRFKGFKVGISLPLIYGSFASDIKSSELKENNAKTEANYYKSYIQNQLKQQVINVEKFEKSLTFYRDIAIPQSDLLLNNSSKSYDNGNINYLEYFQSLNQGISLKLNYINTLNRYNQSVISLEFLINQ